MDIRAYIESGVLEAYALGLCSKEEMAEVERLCSLHPELLAELNAVRSSLETYAQSHAKKAPAAVKAKVFDRIDKEQKSRITRQADLPGGNAVPGKIIQLYSRVRWVAIAAIAFFVMSVGINVILYNRWKKANDEVIALNAEKTHIAEEYRLDKARMDDMHHDLAVMSDPNTMKLMMKGVEKSPNSMAMIYWNRQSKEVFVEVKNLPVPEAGKQYQLWAIVDGKPVDAGMINSDSDSILQRMKDFESAQAFAVTLEKAGGSQVPTLTEMYVLGAITL